MKIRGSVMTIVILTVVGCAGGGQRLEGTATGSPPPATQQDAAQQAQDYRTQAQALRDMADRRLVEAELLARDLGPNDPAVQKKKQMAQELREAADETEGKARERRGQVPHGMVQ